jgi:UDP-N-acetylmuramate--alanine ligase
MPAGTEVELALQVPGLHNVRNALAGLAVAAAVGLSLEQAAAALAGFVGTRRRFEIRGGWNGVTIVDDYAHHPTEIRAALEAARSRFVGRGIWAVWQPHTYSRTRALLQEFAAAFEEADHVLVTDIYRSREPEEDFSSVEVVRRMRHPDARHSGNLEQTERALRDGVRSGDVVVMLSAGDADQIIDRLLEAEPRQP